MAESVETGPILDGKGVSKTCSSAMGKKVAHRIVEPADIARVVGGGRMGFRPEEKGIKTGQGIKERQEPYDCDGRSRRPSQAVCREWTALNCPSAFCTA